MARRPIAENWQFDLIAEKESSRAAALEAAGSPQQLLEQLRIAFARALESAEIRFGCEESESRHNEFRIVIQVRVNPELFDWFFNGRTGYRGHFFESETSGLAFNDHVIEAMRRELAVSSKNSFQGRRFDRDLGDQGAAEI